jgi:hypothetical protein
MEENNLEREFSPVETNEAAENKKESDLETAVFLENGADADPVGTLRELAQKAELEPNNSPG